MRPCSAALGLNIYGCFLTSTCGILTRVLMLSHSKHAVFEIFDIFQASPIDFFSDCRATSSQGLIFILKSCYRTELSDLQSLQYHLPALHLMCTSQELLTLHVLTEHNNYLQQPVKKRIQELLAGLSLSQPCSTCFACLRASRPHSCWQEKKISVWWDPLQVKCAEIISPLLRLQDLFGLFWNERKEEKKRLPL